ncbi:prolyl-tRNA synthetase [Coemansia mojavensis]|nr:prolyl-tRNA synthetase [Coemansia mojavensis]
MLLPTQKAAREQTKDNSASTADILTKAGYIHQSSAGIYTLMPMAQRVIAKIEAIVDEEMQRVGGQKMTLPNLLPPENWKKSGHWDSVGEELFSLKDRKKSTLILGPTHEEEITATVKHMVHSYRRYPLRLYQTARKFRDEARPRAGLLRGREFIMKDLYSFDVSEQSAMDTFYTMEAAYRRCFDRIGVPYAVAEADSGSIGGSMSKEFHFVNSAGEDTLLECKACGYTANEERACSKVSAEGEVDIYHGNVLSENGTVVRQCKAVIPRSCQPNVIKIKQVWPVAAKEKLEFALHATLAGNETENLLESIGYKQDAHSCLLIDTSISSQMANAVKNSVAAEALYLGDWRLAKAGDHCVECQHGVLEAQRAIEVAHIFYLGDKYSKPLDLCVRYQDQNKFVQMGCYGIGISRILQAAAECSNADGRGLRWPLSIAPYLATIVPLYKTDRVSELYDKLLNVKVNGKQVFAGNIAVEDRDYLSAGFRLYDAQLLGFPVTVVLGKKFKQTSEVEVQLRVPLLEAPQQIAGVRVEGDGYEYRAFVHVDKLSEFLACALKGQFKEVP